MDTYLVNIWYRNSDGSKTQSNFYAYGREGFNDAFETIRWDIKLNGATKGTIDRLLKDTSGTELVMEQYKDDNNGR